MARSFGAGQPNCLKCSQCRKRRDIHGRAKRGRLVRTGAERVSGKAAVLRMSSIEREVHCLECGHTGWTRHVDAARLPFKGA